MTDIKKQLLEVIYDGINPETNSRHAFIAGVIYDKAMNSLGDTKKED